MEKVNKKEKNSSYLIDNILSLSKTVGKTQPFYEIWIEYEVLVNSFENLAVKKICCYFEWC